MRALLIEHDAHDATAHQLAMSEDAALRAQVQRVATLPEALRWLEQEPFDLVVLDLSLPQGPGLDALRALREHAPAIPVVVLVDPADADLGGAAICAGAQNYLFKGQDDRATLPPTARCTLCRTRAQGKLAERDRFFQSVLDALATSVAILDRSGPIRARQEDVTVRRRLEQLEHARQDLTRAVRAREHVMGSIAHELRTPLAAVRATVELLISERERLGDIGQFLRMIHDQALQMAAFIDNMLEACRISSGNAQWVWSCFDVEEQLQAALETVRPLIDLERVSLKGMVSRPLMMMRGDADAVRRLLVNLITNARKHTRQGEISVEIEEAVNDHHWIEFRVRDTGRGIDPAVAQKLGVAFALNAGVVGSDHGDGAGVGLAICRGIASAHGGSISVCSRPGQGATFVARLRADLPEPESAPEDAPILLKEFA